MNRVSEFVLGDLLFIIIPLSLLPSTMSSLEGRHPECQRIASSNKSHERDIFVTYI